MRWLFCCMWVQASSLRFCWLRFFFVCFGTEASLGALVGHCSLAETLVGLVLIKTGTPRADWNVLYAHILLSLAGAGIVFAEWAGKRGGHVAKRWKFDRSLHGLPRVTRRIRRGRSLPARVTLAKSARIENPPCRPPLWSKKATALRDHFSRVPRRCTAARKFPASSSWSRNPASAATKTSTTSGTVQPIIFRRSTISGIARASSTCRTRSAPSLRSGAAAATIRRVLYSGMMDTPIKQIVHTPEAQAGLGCMMCHSIAQREEHHGPGRFLLGISRSCMNWPPARIRWCARCTISSSS